MAKRRTSSNKKSNTNYQKEAYGIILLALSLLIGLSIYINPTGYFGIIFRDFFAGLLGMGAYVFPVLLFIISFSLILNKGQVKINHRFICFWSILYNILLILNINISYSNREIGFMNRLLEAYNAGLELRGGGIISEIVDIPLIYIFGKIGTYIVLVCAIIVLTLILTQVSLGSILNSIFNKMAEEIKSIKLKRRVNDKQQDDKLIINENIPLESKKIEEEKKKYEDNIDNVDRKIKILDFIKADIGNGENKNELQGEIKTKTDTNKNSKENLEDDSIEINIPTDKEENIVYQYPPLDLLVEAKVKVNTHDKKELLGNAKLLEQTLQSFGVDAKVVQVSRGPAVTRYELHPGAGVKVSKIVNLSDDIALNLAAPTVRIEAPIPGKAAVGIEIPNKEVVMVTLREVIESKEFMEFNSKVAFSMGKDISGKCIVTDLSKMPHLLIAGATGSGKSVCINTLITSLIYKSTPQEVKMLMIDPKVVELSVYNGIPHLLIPVVTDPKKAASALYWAVNEMTQRYKTFADNNVRNIESYNKMVEENGQGSKMPQVVIIIDELADLMMVAPNDVEDAVCRLAQMARAAGMHLVIATQRPSVDVITGVIKANIPSRISFAVSSQIDSRTILDMSGAEKLLGKGDMLFLPIGEVKPIRIQGAFLSEKEVENIVEYVKNSSTSNYNENIINEIEKEVVKNDNSEDADELLPEAIQLALDSGQISASMLQRRLRVGFNRAARLVEEMESRGIIGSQEGSKPRQVIISRDEYESN